MGSRKLNFQLTEKNRAENIFNKNRVITRFLKKVNYHIFLKYDYAFNLNIQHKFIIQQKKTQIYYVYIIHFQLFIKYFNR